MPTPATEDLNERDWVRASTAARALEVHRDTVLRRAAKGEFRLKTIDDTPYVHREDVERAKEAARASAKVA